MTVVIALVGLTVVNIPFLTVMGLAAAGTVTIAVLIAITLLPAILGFAGTRVARVNRVLGFRPLRKRTPRETMGTRWARFVTSRPLPAMLVSLAVLGAVALPALHMKLGLPDGGSKPTSSTERRAYDLLTEGFGPGFNGTLTVVVDAPNLSSQEQKDLANKLRRRPREGPRRRGRHARPAERGRRPDDRARSRRPRAPRPTRPRTSSNAAAQQGRRHPRSRPASRPT